MNEENSASDPGRVMHENEVSALPDPAANSAVTPATPAPAAPGSLPSLAPQPETRTVPWWNPGTFRGALIIGVVSAVIGGLIVALLLSVMQML